MLKHPKYKNRVQIKFSELYYGDIFWYKSNRYEKYGCFIAPPFWVSGKGNKQGKWYLLENGNARLLSLRTIKGAQIGTYPMTEVKIPDDALVWKEI